MKKVLSLILTATIILGGLAGCKPKETTTTTKGNEEATQTQAEGKETVAANNGKPIRFLDVSPNPERQKFYEDTFAKFTAETGIKVTYESVPWDDAANKITVLGSSKQLPDVLTIHPFWLGQLTSSGWIIPIDEYVEEHRSEFTKAVQVYDWDSQIQQFGHAYTVPDGYMTKGVFYRKDWVEEIGYEIPTGADWTFEEYFKLIKALSDPSKKRYGTSFRGARGAFDIASAYMQTFTKGYTYSEDGTCLFNTPEAVKAFETWCSIYMEGYAPKDSVNWGFVEMVDNFTGGLTGTLINDSEVAVTCSQNMEDSQWGVLPFPASDKDGKTYNQMGSSYGYSISSQATNPEGALQLIDFLSRSDNNMEYCKIAGQIPIKVDLGEDETFGENGPYAAFVSQLNDPNIVKPTPYGAFDYTDLHQDTFHTEMQKYILGKQTAQEALDKISNELTKRMQQYLKDNEGSKIDTPLSIG